MYDSTSSIDVKKEDDDSSSIESGLYEMLFPLKDQDGAVDVANEVHMPESQQSPLKETAKNVWNRARDPHRVSHLEHTTLVAERGEFYDAYHAWVAALNPESGKLVPWRNVTRAEEQQ